MRHPTILILGVLSALPGLNAQNDAAKQAFQKDEEALARRAASALMSFARFAQRNEVGPRAREAYNLILDQYDSDHRGARRALGFRKRKGVWVEPPRDEREQWVDDANDRQRYEVVSRWRSTAVRLAELHRERGLELIADESGTFTAAGVAHLRRAVLYDPFDAEAHRALGHESCEVGGKTYYGTSTQVAFIERMKEVETRALMLAKKDYEVERASDLPAELGKLNLEFHGAKSKHFTVFTRGSQQNADDCAEWAERGLEFLVWLLGEKQARRLRVVERQQAFAWYGFVWTLKEKEEFIRQNPHTIRGERGAERAERFANVDWRTDGGIARVTMKLTPAQMHDALISYVWHLGLGLQRANGGLMEGTAHAATWFLKSTCIQKFGALAEGTVGASDLELPESANWWLRETRDQARAGTDFPINAVPRVQLWKFPNDARLKSWSFMVWLIARFPERWWEFPLKAPHDKIPFPEEIDELGEEVFGVPLAQVEEEWRDWAAGRDVTAAATGYGPPLLPEKPRREELEGLERLNGVRALASVRNINEDGWEAGLPSCRHDAEASIACREHAAFLGMHEDHLKWPEAHEEDPAKAGFTPRGMRAGLRSVIVWSRGNLDPADSIDQWIGTVYHRFPLLQYNIDRIGFGFDGEGSAEVIVLDMGSLEKPRRPEMQKKYSLVAWPPHGMRNVPRGFAYTEHPNPLADHGLDFDAQRELGYPVSLQINRALAQRLTGTATIRLYKLKGRLSPRARAAELVSRHELVPCWVHTPDEPLLARMELRDVLFVIPKQHLEAREDYACLVELEIDGRAKELIWSFRTGSRQHGLGRL